MSTYLVDDTLSLTDAVVPNVLVLVNLTDTLTLSDATPLNLNIIRSAEDRISILDNQGFASVIPGILVQDGLTFSDSSGFLNANSPVLSDAVSISDAISLVLSLPFGVSDTLTLLDASAATFVSTILDEAVAAVDTLSFQDKVELALSNNLAMLQDSLSLSDFVGVVFTSSRNDYLRRYLNDVSLN